MSVKVMAMVWGSTLPPHHRLVLLAYADHANDDGESVYPGEHRIIMKTGYSKGNIRKITAALIAAGFLVRVKQGHRGQRAEYRVILACLLGAQYDTHSEEKGYPNHPERVSESSGKGITRDTPNVIEPSEEPVKVSAKQRTDAFEALYEFWLGKPWKPKTRLTTSQRGKLNAAVKELEQINALDADEIRRRGNQYRQRWRDVTRSPHGLVANWTLFEPEHTPAPPTQGECVHRWASVTNLDGTESRICMLRCGIPEQQLAQPV